MKRLSSILATLLVASLTLMTACQPKAKVGTAYLMLEFPDTLPEYIGCWVYHRECAMTNVTPATLDAHTALLTVDSVVGSADVDVWFPNNHVGVRIVPDDTMHVLLTRHDSICYPDAVRRIYGGALDHDYFRATYLNPVPDNDIVDAIVQVFNGGDMLRHAILKDAGFGDSLYVRELPQMEQRFADIRTRYGKRLDKHLALLTDMRRAYMLRYMCYELAKERGVAMDEVPEAEWLYAFIQPDEPAFASDGYTTTWLEREARKTVPDGKQPQFAYAMLNLADSLLTLPAKALWLDEWSSILFGPASIAFEDFVPLWERYLQVAADCPEVAAKWQKKYDVMMATAPGRPVKDVMLQAPDGSEVQLSSLFGKLLYIDVWATWCVPCCAEIPYLETMVEQFKDNPDVAFVSLSIDRTAAPWLQKLTADRPAWAQYRLTPEQNKLFSDAWDIQSIPRFLMIAPDGTICNANAPRPSSPHTAAYIEECLAKYRQ